MLWPKSMANYWNSKTKERRKYWKVPMIWYRNRCRKWWALNSHRSMTKPRFDKIWGPIYWRNLIRICRWTRDRDIIMLASRVKAKEWNIDWIEKCRATRTSLLILWIGRRRRCSHSGARSFPTFRMRWGLRISEVRCEARWRSPHSVGARACRLPVSQASKTAVRGLKWTKLVSSKPISMQRRQQKTSPRFRSRPTSSLANIMKSFWFPQPKSKTCQKFPTSTSCSIARSHRIQPSLTLATNAKQKPKTRRGYPPSWNRKWMTKKQAIWSWWIIDNLRRVCGPWTVGTTS